jgi:hypothetical protein
MERMESASFGADIDLGNRQRATGNRHQTRL